MSEYVEEFGSRFEVMWATMWQWRKPHGSVVAGYGKSWDFINFDLIHGGRTVHGKWDEGAGLETIKWGTGCYTRQ